MNGPSNRFRTCRHELLESRCLLNAAPIGVADEYQIEKDTLLVAARPPGLDSFATGFGDGALAPHLEGDGFVVLNGKVHRSGAAHLGDRAYVRTVDAGFLNVDFRFEVTLTTSNFPDTAIYYVGLGRGEGDPGFGGGEPQGSLFLRIHGPNTAGGYVSISNSPASDLDIIGTLPTAGTHRFRVEKSGNSATFSVDQNFSGVFVPDISHVVNDIATTAPFLVNATTRLFFGTAVEPDSFDDVVVEVISLPGVLVNDSDADGDALTVELISGPGNGTLNLFANGTFTYQPNPGFVGTDSFTYVARDAFLASAPTEVSIVVSSSNVAPVGVPDHYVIPQGTSLAASRPLGGDGFVEDFEDGTLFPHLEGAGFVIQNGVARRQGATSQSDRAYVRTKQADFLTTDFRYQVLLTTSLVNSTAIYYVGIGSGRGDPNIGSGEPKDSLYLRIHGPNTAGGFVGIGNRPADHFETIGFLREPGTHAVRVDKIGNTATFSIDEHFSGEFTADISFTVSNLATTAPFLTPTSTRLFFGTAIEQDYFDDFSLTYLTPAGVLANDIDENGDVLTAELLNEPDHGTLVFHANGTFTYTPQINFVGTDTFTYRAKDADSASDPTNASIRVTSTNVAPVAVADFYSFVRGQPLQTVVAPSTQVIAQQVFFTDFDDELPSNFTGTTTLAGVQGYAGLGNGPNVFTGRMLRNQTGMAIPLEEVPYSPVIPTRLVLNNLPKHDSVDIRFLLAAIDSWDGNTPLPDIMAVTVDGELVFVDTLDGSSLADQSYLPPPNVLLVHNTSLGFNPQFPDAAYDMGFEPRLQNIRHTSDSITIEWFTYGQGWSAAFRENESWGIDNVEVIVNTTIHSPLGVLANDSDQDLLQSLAAILETGPSHGSLSLAEDGSFTYTPTGSFAGRDSFSYRATDGMAVSEPVWVSIEVRPDASPIVAVDDRYRLSSGQTLVAGARSVIRDIATGFKEGAGEKLRDLAADLDFRIVASPSDLYTGQTPATMAGEQPVGGYLPDSGSAGSRWIGVLRNLPNDFSIEPGEYVFETTVIIDPEFAAHTALISGLRLAADNSVVSMAINNVPVLTSTLVGFDRLFHVGDVGLGVFHPGVNLIQITVRNDNGGRNPMGLRLEGRVVAQPAAGAATIAGVLANDFLSSFSVVGERVVSVGGTSDSWLAGMPDGSRASFDDVAPAQSPVRVPSLPLQAGDVLRFAATGKVGNSHDLQVFPLVGPDGGFFLQHETRAENGISNLIAPLNSVVGVFLGNSPPHFFAAPPTLDFRSGGNVAGGVNYTSLSPRLQQVFFIGDGLTESGQRQQVVVPQGATRLFLGTMDGFRWADNIGRFDVQVLTASSAPVGAMLQDGPAHGQLQLAANGSFIYTPNVGFVGFDRFTYEVMNGRGGSDNATVVLRVGNFNLPGDFNANNRVEQADLDLVLLNWGAPAEPLPQGWFGDPPTGTIDQDELDAVLLNWGATVVANASVKPVVAPLVQAVQDDASPAPNSKLPADERVCKTRPDRRPELKFQAQSHKKLSKAINMINLDHAFAQLGMGPVQE